MQHIRKCSTSVSHFLSFQRSCQKSSGCFTDSPENENEGPSYSSHLPPPIPSFNNPELHLVLTPGLLKYATAKKISERPQDRASRWLREVDAVRIKRDSALAAANVRIASIFSGNGRSLRFPMLPKAWIPVKWISGFDAIATGMCVLHATLRVLT